MPLPKRKFIVTYRQFDARSDDYFTCMAEDRDAAATQLWDMLGENDDPDEYDIVQIEAVAFVVADMITNEGNRLAFHLPDGSTCFSLPTAVHDGLLEAWRHAWEQYTEAVDGDTN